MRKAFTLIELLVVIGVLAVLLAITLIAINPARQFSQSNDTKRSSDVNAILNAVHQYAADNKGTLPAGITTTGKLIRLSNPADPATDANICAALVPTYLAALPVDPLTNNGTPITDCTGGVPLTYTTNYTIVASATNNRITVTATATEVATTDISVTR
ncbi:MAG: Uncharacterized protein G01um101416_166 [Microgenomates group bacterium Gr01-1014_16]|nr:MAG: Uncharacterized protein G01um101416_166 [Microgenomates group bacterium Gr01-1014_16]